jgi:hypothetical protein
MSLYTIRISTVPGEGDDATESFLLTGIILEIFGCSLSGALNGSFAIAAIFAVLYGYNWRN